MEANTLNQSKLFHISSSLPLVIILLSYFGQICFLTRTSGYFTHTPAARSYILSDKTINRV